MEKRNVKKFPLTTFWKEAEDDVIFWNYSEKIEIDISKAKQLVQNRLDYSEGKLVYTVIDFTNVKSVTKEARDFMNDPTGGLKGILGGAFLSNNSVATLFINLYLKINKPIVPAKFFTNKSDAVEWISRLKRELSVKI